MWAKAERWVQVAIAAPFVLLFAGFGVGTSVSVPQTAVVYVDDAAKVVLAPPCADQYEKKAPAARLTATTMADADARHYELDNDCKEAGWFSQDGPSLTELLITQIGLWPRKTYWWDQWSVADEKAEGVATGPFIDCIGNAAAAFDDGKHAVDDVANMIDTACSDKRDAAFRYMSAACVKAGHALADCRPKLDDVVHKKEVAMVQQWRAREGWAARARSEGDEARAPAFIPTTRAQHAKDEREADQSLAQVGCASDIEDGDNGKAPAETVAKAIIAKCGAFMPTPKGPPCSTDPKCVQELQRINLQTETEGVLQARYERAQARADQAKRAYEAAAK